jgi:hypothetical protein
MSNRHAPLFFVLSRGDDQDGFPDMRHGSIPGIRPDFCVFFPAIEITIQLNQ